MISLFFIHPYTVSLTRLPGWLTLYYSIILLSDPMTINMMLNMFDCFNHLLYCFTWVYLFIAKKVYSVKPKTEAIMYDIYKNGPVVAAMKVYDDFLYYKDG